MVALIQTRWSFKFFYTYLLNSAKSCSCLAVAVVFFTANQLILKFDWASWAELISHSGYIGIDFSNIDWVNHNFW